MCLCEREDNGSNYSSGCNRTNHRYTELAAGFATGAQSVVMSLHNDDLCKWENILCTGQKEPPGNGIITVIMR